MKISFICILVILLATINSKAQSNLLSSERLQSRIKNEMLTFKMSLNGDSTGYSIVNYQTKNNILEISEDVNTVISGNTFIEKISASIDLNKQRVTSTEIFIDYGGQSSKIKSTWESDSIIIVSANGIDSTLKAKENHILRFVSLFVLPSLIHDEEKNINYTQFYPADIGFRLITAEPSGSTILESRFGPTPVNILKLNGGITPQTFYINKDNHRIVRIELPEMGWVYELVSIE